MSSSVSSLLRRHLRRVNNQIKMLQRRQRATISASLEDLQPDVTTEPGIREVKSHPKIYQDLPSPKGLPIFGTLFEFLASGGVQNQHNYINKRHQQLGGIFKENLAGREFVYISDPTAIREVFANEGQYPKHFIPDAWLLYNEDRQEKRGLFFMDNEEWKSNRRVLNRRLLRSDAVRPHFASFAEVADSLVQHWMKSHAGTVIPNLEKELYRWAIESLGVMVFGYRLGFVEHQGKTTASSDESSFRRSEMEKFISAIHGIFKETCAMGTFPPALARALKLPMWTKFTETYDRALSAGQQLVLDGLKSSKERLSKGLEPHSLLDHLVFGEEMKDEEIVSLLTDLFLAAADTTSHTAIWSLYLLGQHPHVVEKVRQEIEMATGDSNTVKGEHLPSLSYLKGVVKETLRLYPVAPFITRALDRDTLLGGHVVPAGTMVILSIYTTGRDPTQFQNAEQFLPERWLRESSDAQETSFSTASPSASCPFSATFKGNDTNSNALPLPPSRLHSHAYIPFGVGARSCIGRRIAETQLHLMLANLIKNCDITSLNEVDMVMRMVGVTSQPLQLRIDPLEKNT